MGEGVAMGLAVLAGVVIGALFFGSLRWTVGQALTSDYPAVWFLGSVLLRTSLALMAYFAVGQGHWDRYVLCALGFVLAKFLVLGWNALADPPAVADAP